MGLRRGVCAPSYIVLTVGTTTIWTCGIRRVTFTVTQTCISTSATAQRCRALQPDVVAQVIDDTSFCCYSRSTEHL